MIKLHPEILHHEGKPQFAVLPYKEFLAVQEELEDASSLRILRKAKASEADAPTVSLKSLKARLRTGSPRKAGRTKALKPLAQPKFVKMHFLAGFAPFMLGREFSNLYVGTASLVFAHPILLAGAI